MSNPLGKVSIQAEALSLLASCTVESTSAICQLSLVLSRLKFRKKKIRGGKRMVRNALRMGLHKKRKDNQW
ncbi:unnamed protein product [marine sediment metagenome]|uniref:Uncharacterized protein n=1 Tax=marine sediment metagenome TaxID=412755 RepID=X0SPK4_9ZZZZ